MQGNLFYGFVEYVDIKHVAQVHKIFQATTRDLLMRHCTCCRFNIHIYYRLHAHILYIDANIGHDSYNYCLYYYNCLALQTTKDSTIHGIKSFGFVTALIFNSPAFEFSLDVTYNQEKWRKMCIESKNSQSVRGVLSYIILIISFL